MVFCNLKTFTFKKIIIKYCDHSSILFTDDYFEACEEVKAIIKGNYMKNVGGVDGDGVDGDGDDVDGVDGDGDDVDGVDGVDGDSDDSSNVLSVNSVDTVYSFSSEDLGLTKHLAL
jgi:hypothetical protein